MDHICNIIFYPFFNTSDKAKKQKKNTQENKKNNITFITVYTLKQATSYTFLHLFMWVSFVPLLFAIGLNKLKNSCSPL